MSVPRLRYALALCFLTITVQPVHAVSEFYGYRIPDHHWSAWNGNLSFSGNRLKSDQSPDLSATDGRFDFRAATSMTWGRDSDREQHSLSLTPSVSGFRSGSERRLGVPLIEQSRTRQQLAAESTELVATTTRFSGSLPLGLSASAVFRGDLQQSWDALGRSQHAPPQEQRSVGDHHSTGHQYVSSVSIGPIVGRVRNATPVLDAVILQERLMHSGALTRALSEKGRARLAELLATRGAFNYAHARSGRWFWREVERLLREDGALRDQGLDAYSVLRVLENVSPALVPRLVGASCIVFANASAVRRRREDFNQFTVSQLDHDTVVVSSRVVSETEFDSRSDAANVGYLVEYHRPVNPRWQLDATQQMSWNDAAGALFLYDRLSATWLVADRWRASSNWLHSAFSRDRSGGRKFSDWQIAQNAELQYQLEDAWGLSLSWQHSQTHTSASFARGDAFLLGLNYQFSGRFVAPGLVEPMSLAPPNR